VEGVREIAYANGSALAIRRELFESFGRFAEELFIYLEDAELSWRARLAGRRVILEPAADICPTTTTNSQVASCAPP
jgi:GT2 family glycosyltransferase